MPNISYSFGEVALRSMAPYLPKTNYSTEKVYESFINGFKEPKNLQIDEMEAWITCIFCGKSEENEKDFIFCEGCDIPSHFECVSGEEIDENLNWKCEICYELNNKWQSISPPPPPSQFIRRGFKYCQICKEYVENMKKHNIEMHKTKDGKWLCDICGRTLCNKTVLYSHINLHRNELLWPCGKCEKSFPCKWRLRYHSVVHMEKKHKCEFCGKKFARKGEYSSHRRIHTGEKPFICEFCGKTFAHPTTCAGHRRIHTGEKPFICEFCGRRFSRASSRSMHRRTHVKERRYKCEECGKCFRRSTHLTSHKRFVHRGYDERPLECSTCKKRFIGKSSLKVHIRTHKGERPFSCGKCGKGFTQSGDRNRHEKRCKHLKV